MKLYLGYDDGSYVLSSSPLVKACDSVSKNYCLSPTKGMYTDINKHCADCLDFFSALKLKQWEVVRLSVHVEKRGEAKMLRQTRRKTATAKTKRTP